MSRFYLPSVFLPVFQLTFTHFQLESGEECEYDSVTISYMGPTSYMMGKYCGSDSPGTITSSSNNLMVVFKADSSETDAGFHAIWTASDSSGNFILFICLL